ncbi:MAG: hypothetical protein ACOZF0_02295 [Thermodesulfobacteriota bacterium]
MDSDYATNEERKAKGLFHYRDGRLYFSRQLERRLFFAGTIIMLIWGFIVKIGLL